MRKTNKQKCTFVHQYSCINEKKTHSRLKYKILKRKCSSNESLITFPEYYILTSFLKIK